MKIKTNDMKAYQKEYQKEYRKKNSVKIRELSRKWRRQHGIMPKEKKIIKDLDSWNEERKKKLREYHIAYYHKNKEKALIRVKSYRKKMPLLKMCELCERRFAKERHHRDYTKPNLVLFVCVQCHRKI